MLDVDALAGLYACPEAGRPWIRTNFVSTIDGAVQDAQGVSGDLGGAPDHRAFTVMRSLCDVVLVGAGTVRAEGYRPISAESIHASLREGRDRTPMLAIVSRRLDIPAPLLAPGVIVITAESAPADDRARLAERVDVLVAGERDIDWAAVLDVFASRGLQQILCEGGPQLHGTLVEQDLVDEACVTVSPQLMGGATKRITEGARAVERPMLLGHAVADDGVLLTRWVRDRDTA